ncbi:type VI secretion system protein [Alphaproteobacteria bacterium]|nr:type VI secretion system protein [Alphaproteobacteria bacterium]
MPDQDFLDYYYCEMDYLREVGALFAKDFPNIAGRLSLNSEEAADPHVERLLESFAFLTARVQKNVNNAASDITNALLDVLYPHLNKPLPALSIAQFHTKQGSNAPPPAGALVKRETELFVYSTDDNLCKFRTLYPLKLLPIFLDNVAIVSHGQYQFVPIPSSVEFGYQKHKEIPTYFLELTLKSYEENFSQLALSDLIFYLNVQDLRFKKEIYQAIFSGASLAYAVRGEDKMAFPLLPQACAPMGFEREEMALPPLHYETHAYQLLQEFFHFSEKFMFFKVQKLELLKHLRKGNFLNTKTLTLLIPLHHALSEWTRKIQKTDVLMNCTPIVNLFKNTTDPVTWDRKQTFYHLSPNAQKDRTREIYQIDNIWAIDADTGKEKRVCPYFSLENAVGAAVEEEDTENLYWWSKMEATKHKNLVGGNSWVTFVDARSQAVDPTPYVFYAKTLCTNRFLAEDIQQNTVFQSEAALPVQKITCLQRPVFPQYSLEKGPNNAKLISQLSANYLGFPYGRNEKMADALKALLARHVGEDKKEYSQALLAHLREVTLQKCVKRVGHEAWRGFVEGTKIEIVLKKSQNVEEWFLLAQILQRYFAINCQVNTFVAVVLKEEERVLSSFEGLSGEQFLL